jgi:hypothetical protein
VSRRGRRVRRIVLAAALAVVALYALRVVLWRPLPVGGPRPDDGYTRVRGVVHVHTTLSDGGGTPEEVIAAAKAAGLSFVVLTDHNNLDAKPQEGYHDGLLVLVGTEVSTTAGHLLGLGIADPAFRFPVDPLDALDDVRHLGGVVFAAHPTSPVPTFRWTGWELPGPWGVELLNGDSQWREAGVPRLLRTLALYGLNHRYALLTSLTPPGSTLARWDRLLRERDTSGIAGADAHSRIPLGKEGGVRFPSYESLFGLVRNHVLLAAPLTGDASADGQAILTALARGRSYVGLDALAPADGFLFVAERDGERWTMGDTAPPASGLRLRAGGALPAGARLRLLRDGQPVLESEKTLTLDGPPPGVYRAEVVVPGWSVPWVLSNPIYVFGAETAAARRERAAWPAEAAPPPAVQTLDAFDGTTVFQPGADPTSRIDGNILDRRGGIAGSGAARLGFRLAAPGPGRPHTFCALVDWTHRDLSGRQGLVFSIRGDGVYRVRVEVRDENPASADEGTEWWSASVRTSPEWRRIALPFARLRSINPRTDGRLDLGEVRAIVFVLDRGTVKVGTEGTIWIDDLGVY